MEPARGGEGNGAEKSNGTGDIRDEDALVYGTRNRSNRSRNLSGFRRSKRPMFGQYMVLLAIQVGGALCMWQEAAPYALVLAVFSFP